ncbi:MAG: hypothetical protein A2042_05020 [Candidatus Schekmanbacteria bacterium GWA2_38_11]|uniref:Type II secretion system protein GspF domain-containing protein n=1 Tax=Candidatus Schekmanbacteria bacterium GWA2_38_11 TaxID=1817876 RepID=A0A1F7RQU5_9BACT|nr:MAG: hypothetical protein A2042_05020 [Candidatus Schekmanbacteria bacterium GWA2_38_11]
MAEIALNLPDIKEIFGKLKGINLFKKRVKLRDIICFTNQLEVMTEMGTGLVPSLKALYEQTENETLKEAIKTIVVDVEEGKMLSHAMGKHPKVFSNVYASMIKAGETGGVLNEMLKRLTVFQEKWEKMISSLKSATTYPMILIGFAFTVVIFMVSFVLPRFVGIFHGQESLLPAPTRILLNLTGFFKSYWYLVMIFILMIIGGVHYFLKQEKGGYLLDKFKIKAPLIGKLYQNIYVGRIMRIIGVMLDAGIPLLEGVQVTRATMDNRLYASFIDDVMDNIKRGIGISTPFNESPLIPATIKQMVKTGEASGALGRVMMRMADFYDEESERYIKKLTTFIEPAMIVCVGAIIAFIAMSIILPIFKMSSTVGK